MFQIRIVWHEEDLCGRERTSIEDAEGNDQHARQNGNKFSQEQEDHPRV